MADQANGSTGQESGTGSGAQGQESGAGQQNQQQQGQQGQQQQSGQQGTRGQEPPDLSAITDPTVRAYVEAQLRDAADARREAASYRTRASAAEQQAQQLRQANETEAQRIQRERDEATARSADLERKVRDLTVGSAVRDALTTAKAFNPATALKMLDLDKIALDDAGMPVKASLDQAIADLRQSDPYLFQRTSADAGAGTGSGSSATPSMNDLIRAAAGRGTIPA
jgi:Phage minor structural protein GP20.